MNLQSIWDTNWVKNKINNKNIFPFNCKPKGTQIQKGDQCVALLKKIQAGRLTFLKKCFLSHPSTPGIGIIIILQRVVKSLAKLRFDKCLSMYRPSGPCLPPCFGKNVSAWIVPVLRNLIGNKYCSKCNRYYLALPKIGKQSVCWGQFIVCAIRDLIQDMKAIDVIQICSNPYATVPAEQSYPMQLSCS